MVNVVVVCAVPGGARRDEAGETVCRNQCRKCDECCRGAAVVTFVVVVVVVCAVPGGARGDEAGQTVCRNQCREHGGRSLGGRLQLL